MFNDKIELKDFEKTDPEYQELLRRVLAIQADCEIGGPNLYVKDILPNAPRKVDQLIVARTAAEEMDHYRKMARLAGDMGVDVSYVLSRSNQERYVEAFRGTITTWEDFSVFGFLIDRVGRFQLEEFIGASYQPLARVVEDPQVIREEEGHIDFGTNCTAECAAKGGEAKERIQKSVDYWYTKGLDMFGKSQSYRSERYRYWGLKRRTNAEAREQYTREVNALIEKMGLQIPDPNKGRLYT
ncbi:MAG TPA: Phenylacetic acid catabolic protein [Candidatus Binatia bacterium]|jgi:ring-1,2-phenylacetyl-CoA epoxidase subunit PaaA|nr:Phenylacetic acid catabolic protein [Candidatus Binatia bacterium]